MYEIFHIKKGDIITLTGAGGKTSLMMALATELAQIGKVLITTTTKIYKPLNTEFQKLILKDSTFVGQGKNIFVLGDSIEDNKLTGVSYQKIYNIKNQYDFILIEGDGAKEKIFKEWNENEPCIPPISNKIIGVINMEILDRGLSKENVHRFELFSQNYPTYISHKVSQNFLTEYIKKAKFFKNSTADDRYLFFNGIDGENSVERFSLAISTCNELKKINYQAEFVLGSIIENKIYQYVPVSAIVMASGFSRRMGQDKLKLKYNGVSLLENVLDKLNFANFFEILVCGRDSWTENICKKYNCKYLHNTKANLGQSESIKLGVQNSSGKGFVFFTGDQVFLTPDTISKLYYNFEKYGYITVPTSNGDRYSPVFFPYSKKEALLALQGDHGGKNIIRNTPLVSLVDFPYSQEFLDIDTPEDYSLIVEK